MKIRLLIIWAIIAVSFVKAQDESLYEKAIYEFSRGAFSAAFPLFKEYVQTRESNNPLAASAQFYSAECLYKLGDNQGAVFEYERLVTFHQLSNFREEALYKLGLIYYNLEQYEKCRKRLSLLIETYPDNEHYGAALYWIGEAFTIEQKFQEAIAFFEQAIRAKRNNKFLDYSVYTLATVYEKTGDYKKAVEFYDLLLSYYKSSTLVPSAQIRIGFCYFKLKEYESSIIELSNPIVKSLPVEKQAEALYMLGNSLFRTAEYDKAKTTFLEIIDRFPAIEFIREIKYSLAWCHFQQKQYQDAFKTFSPLAEGGDSIARLSLYWKGECQRYMGKDNEALKNYQEFLKRYPSSPMVQGVQFQAGIIYYNNKMYEKAANFLNSAASSADMDVRARSLILLGELELNRQKYSLALKYFSTAKSINGLAEALESRSLLGAGAASFYLNKYDEAIKNLKELEEKRPNFENEKVQFYLAESFFNNENYKQALDRYRHVSADVPEIGSSALYGLAYSYYNLKDFENAGFSFSDFIRQFPKDNRAADARLRLADTYLTAKRYAEASAIYDELLKQKSSAAAKDYLTYQYGLTLYKSGKSQQAISEFNRMLSAFPKSVYTENSLYMIGWIRFQQGKLQEAINSYAYLVSYAPNSKLMPLVYYSIGDACYNMGSYDSAMTYYNKVIHNYSGSSYLFDAVNGLQLCYIAKGELDKASALIDDFVQSNKKAGFADQLFYKKGEMYFNQGNYEQAIESYRDFVTRFPKSKLASKAYLGIGKSAQLTGDVENAAVYFKKVFDLYPGSEEAAAAVVEAGKIYTAQGNYDAAVNLYDQAIQKIKNDNAKAEFLYYKGVNLNNKGDTGGAYDVFDEIVLYYDGSLFADKARYELGLIELKAKRYANAAKYLQALHSKRTDDLGAGAQYYSGVMFMEQNKLNDAVTAFVRVQNVFANFEEWVVKSNIKLASCYEQMKDTKKAKEIYKLILSRHKDDEFGKDAQKKLKRLK